MAGAWTSGEMVRLPGDGGFTLLEVLVAFAIAAPALALLFGQGVQSVTAAQAAARYREAISRAQSRLDAMAEQALAAGDRNGEDGHGFHWRTRIVAAASIPAQRQLPAGSAYAAGTTLYDVTVEVSWSGGAGTRAVTLGTRRLGPAAARGP